MKACNTSAAKCVYKCLTSEKDKNSLAAKLGLGKVTFLQDHIMSEIYVGKRVLKQNVLVMCGKK